MQKICMALVGSGCARSKGLISQFAAVSNTCTGLALKSGIHEYWMAESSFVSPALSLSSFARAFAKKMSR